MAYKGVAVAAATAVAVVGTIAYLDHVRTSDPEYRKKVKARKAAAREAKIAALAALKEKAKAEAEAAKAEAAEAAASSDKDAVGAFFVAQMQAGQEALNKGDLDGCATHFANAVTVSETPIDILVYLKQSIPEELFSLMVKKIDPEVLRDKYFDNFPGEDTGLRVEPTDIKYKQNCMFAVKDFAEGDVFHTEKPFLSALLPDMDPAGYCGLCAIVITDVVPCAQNCGQEFYCSTDCRDVAFGSHHAILCSGAKFSDPTDPMAMLVAHTKSTGRKEVLMVGKALAQVFNPKPVRDCTADIAHLSFDEPLPAPNEMVKKEFALLLPVLTAKVEQAEQILTLDSYTAMLSKIKRNAIPFTTHPNPKGLMVKSGHAVYLAGSFMNHSCDPNVKISFVKKTNQIQYTARKAIKAGDEVCFAYNGFSMKKTEERRAELKKAFAFDCMCGKCVPEVPQPKLSMEHLEKKLAEQKKATENMKNKSTPSPEQKAEDELE
ncbi:hypothetical protein SARC_03282 [Sphaeroforma arctica JP610]|uniref:SET domain-containing protein n=1 Tax=Sphaeroforma arctica JP610 TaxID=667725 RepID=A0A0L0G8D9_9EUKA|nr:hypothetical protein SARC_03282 [Sphaeroforma arctica JP610]KNC84508.1 hypothetical protein SARC_03282 [Sphaeroforma arctica JP610]|eukprot:XP_014158410.1 hypothetical protein SARC_03282 [Sphaeroforma arctica JP610]